MVSLNAIASDATRSTDDPIPHLELLAVRLRSEGWYVRLVKGAPLLRVVNPRSVSLMFTSGNPLRPLTRRIGANRDVGRPLPPPEPTVNVVLPTPPAEAVPQPPAPDSPRHVCCLDGDPEAVRTARALVTNALVRWDPDLVEDAVLVTSELVTNAFAHGRPPIVLTVIGGRQLVIEVADASPDLPVKNLPGEIGHFGMWLAEELATVSIHPGPYGKTVRATF